MKTRKNKRKGKSLVTYLVTCFLAYSAVLLAVGFAANLISAQFLSNAQIIKRILWYSSIPLAILVMVLCSYFISRKLKRDIFALDDAIETYRKGSLPEIDSESLPIELRSVAENLELMINRLEESRTELEHNQVEKQRILSNLSHDLKTPLTVIEGYSNALKDGLVPEADRQKYYTVINDRCSTMAELVDTLLKYTRISEVNYELDLVSTDLCEFSRRYFSEKFEEISLAGFELEIDIPDAPIWIKMDRKLMRRAYDNLLGNALKYNPSGTRLYIAVSEHRNYAEIISADTGIGLSPELKRIAFEPMVSGNKARTTGSGVGIGLTIVRRVAELHGGTASFIDLPGYSTGNRFTLPLDQEPNKQ